MKFLSVFLCVLLASSAGIQAAPGRGQESAHIVSIQELRNQISERTAARTRNIHEVQTLLRHQAVQAHMGRLFDLEKIALGIPALDDETLERLARESHRINEQFQAGLSKQTMTWVVIAGIAAFAIIVLIKVYDGCTLQTGRPC